MVLWVSAKLLSSLFQTLGSWGQAKKSANEINNEGGLKRGTAREPIRISSSGIARAAIPSDWVILTVVSILPHLVSI